MTCSSSGRGGKQEGDGEAGGGSWFVVHGGGDRGVFEWWIYHFFSQFALGI